MIKKLLLFVFILSFAFQILDDVKSHFIFPIIFFSFLIEAVTMFFLFGQKKLFIIQTSKPLTYSAGSTSLHVIKI
jgi:hypothetical protein